MRKAPQWTDSTHSFLLKLKYGTVSQSSICLHEISLYLDFRRYSQTRTVPLVEMFANW